MNDIHAAVGERLPSPGYSWLGLLAAPLTWFADQQVGYVLVYISCANQTRAYLGLTSAVAVFVVAALGWWAWQGWTATRDARTVAGFLHLVALLVCAMFVLVILATALTRVMLPPCAL